MEKHDVQVVEVEEKSTFKGELVEFIATYEYCPNTQEYWETEEMLSANDIILKDSYKTKVGLLTSSEIRSIREKYDMSQSDFSDILGFGGKTITRYENHYVQERTYDNLIRRCRDDYKYLLELIDVRMSKGEVPARYYKYYERIRKLMELGKNNYEIVVDCNFTKKISLPEQNNNVFHYNGNIVTIEMDTNIVA
ncbi:MAG: hypothetical protein LKE29_10830 [Acidaminococcaceae bacterium]|nr:hypothetical protein [Acidaminococcaceae bacterium]